MLRAREYGMGRIVSVPLIVPVTKNGYCCAIGFGADSVLVFLTSCLAMIDAEIVLATLEKARRTNMVEKYMMARENYMIEWRAVYTLRFFGGKEERRNVEKDQDKSECSK